MNFYRCLFWIRRASQALSVGSYSPVEVPGNVYAYVRKSGTERKLIVLNFDGSPSTVTTNLKGKGVLVLSTHPDYPVDVDLSEMMLRPHEGIIVDF